MTPKLKDILNDLETKDRTEEVMKEILHPKKPQATANWSSIPIAPPFEDFRGYSRQMGMMAAQQQQAMMEERIKREAEENLRARPGAMFPIQNPFL